MTTIIGGRRIHPVTMALPEMEPDQYEGLKADLEERGQMLPILEDGEQRIVDGRHRPVGSRFRGNDVGGRACAYGCLAT